MAFDEKWTYLGIRCGGVASRLVWLWTAVIERAGLRPLRAYEVGDRDESAFSRLLDRLKGAEMYEADDYPVYGVGELLRDRHMIGSGSGELE